jgi:hypothetical protein
MDHVRGVAFSSITQRAVKNVAKTFCTLLASSLRSFDRCEFCSRSVHAGVCSDYPSDLGMG